MQRRGAFSLRAAAEERPDAPGVVSASGTLTFGALWKRAEPMLHELGATPPGGSVAIIATLRVETLLAIYALAELRIPMVLLHPRLTAPERARLVEASGASRVLDERWSPAESTPPSSALPSPRDVDDEAPLATLFTSGSTGMPKGVQLSRRAFLAAAEASAENLGWTAEDRWLLCMPLGHVGGLSVILRCLAARVPIVMSPWTNALGPLLDDVDRCGASLLSLVPTMLARILDELPSYRFPAHVRAVLLGGDAASPGLLAAAAARGVPILTTYGMTEACSQVATLSPSERATAESGVGKPLHGTEVRFVDGELQVRSATLFTKYVPEHLFPSPFLEGGWFPTGDLGRLDDAGRIHVTGRKSDLVITGGENVDPREVEAALEEHPAVRAACVFGIKDERWGEIVGAAVVLHPGATATGPEIVADAKTRLARHKWPRRVAVCTELTYNATSKLDRKKTGVAVAEKLEPVG